MPNKHTFFPFNQYVLNMLKSCVRGTQSPTSEFIIQSIEQRIFSSRLTDNGKILYFPWYFGDLDLVETGVSEEGINSMKTLPKSSKSFWRVEALIISWQISILRFLTYFLCKKISIDIFGTGTLCLRLFHPLCETGSAAYGRPCLTAVLHSTDCQPW